MNENERSGVCDEEGRGVGGFIVIQEAMGEEHHDSARPPWHGSPACPQSKPTAAINGKN